jgi:hypothetical protein
MKCDHTDKDEHCGKDDCKGNRISTSTETAMTPHLKSKEHYCAECAKLAQKISKRMQKASKPR